MDAKKLNQILLNNVTQLLSEWLPGGKQYGNEYKCGSIKGEAGNSLSVNTTTGVWKDFADQSVKGGDLISLYAAVENITNGEAIKILSARFMDAPPTKRATTVIPKEKPKQIPAPIGSPQPDLIAEFKQHSWRGRPQATWTYRNQNGEAVGIIARYQPTDKKEILPWSHTENGWIKGAMDKPRPLYNLPEILSNTDKKILIVEGEKCADVAAKLFHDVYTVTTWAGGSQAVKYTDLTPLYNRKIVIWPDADEAGAGAGEYLLNKLVSFSDDLKIIKPTGQPDGWDIADAAQDMDRARIISFMKDNHQVIKPYALPEAVQRPTQTEVLPPDTEVTLTKSSDPVPIYNALAMASQLGLQVDGKQMPVPNASNVYTILAKVPEFKDICYYDEFKNAYMTTWKTGKLRQWTEVEERQLMIYLQSNYGMPKLPKHIVVDALLHCADGNLKHPLREWLDSLVWDQTPRIDILFSSYCGAEDNDYSRAVSKNFMLKIVARIYKPGCKVDNMVILEGAQGATKSSFFSSLITDEYLLEAKHNIESNDFIIAAQGKMFVEIAELAGFIKSDPEAIKNILTIRNDIFRPPYGRVAKVYPRQFCFGGSTNAKQYLKDTTGNRRFWPIACSIIKNEEISRDREQLFAEAVHRFKQGESWWEVPSSAKEEQADRLEDAGWEDVLLSYINKRTLVSPITKDELFLDCLGLEIKDLSNKLYKNKLAESMENIGYENVRRRINGQRSYVYLKKDTGQKDRVTGQQTLTEKSQTSRVVMNYATNQEVEIND